MTYVFPTRLNAMIHGEEEDMKENKHATKVQTVYQNIGLGFDLVLPQKTKGPK